MSTIHGTRVVSRSRVVANVFIFTDILLQVSTVEEFLTQVLQSIRESKIGYAGFKTKKDLAVYLRAAMFYTSEGKMSPFDYPIEERGVLRVITDSVTECHQIVPTAPTQIFVFPTFSDFVKRKMGGTNGYTPWKNTILLFVNPVRGW